MRMSKKKFKRWWRSSVRLRGRWQKVFKDYGYYHPLWFWEV